MPGGDVALALDIRQPDVLHFMAGGAEGDQLGAAPAADLAPILGSVGGELSEPVPLRSADFEPNIGEPAGLWHKLNREAICAGEFLRLHGCILFLTNMSPFGNLATPVHTLGGKAASRHERFIALVILCQSNIEAAHASIEVQISWRCSGRRGMILTTSRFILTRVISLSRPMTSDISIVLNTKSLVCGSDS